MAKVDNSYDFHGWLTEWTLCETSFNIGQQLLYADGSTIRYIYTAAGAKLSEIAIITDGDTLSRRDYVSNLEITQRAGEGKDIRLLLAEGYITLADTTFHAYIPDYQGNIIAVYNTKTDETEQQTDYYPYGLPHADTEASAPQSTRRKYGAKELMTDHGLNLYDFEARHQNPAFPHFTTPDPLGEKYQYSSIYTFCNGDPINCLDPLGLEWEYNESKKQIILNLNIVYNETISDDLKSIIQESIFHYFNYAIADASNGEVSIQINFFSDNPELLQTLYINQGVESEIIGMTMYVDSYVNAASNLDSYKSLKDFSFDVIHELLHTLRLDHPFERTQTSDTELIWEGGNNFSTTSNTDPHILNNVMNYSSTIINGQKSFDQYKITPGQFNFMLDEIKRQQQGAGFKTLQTIQTNNSAPILLQKKIDQNYWEYPGKAIK